MFKKKDAAPKAQLQDAPLKAQGDPLTGPLKIQNKKQMGDSAKVQGDPLMRSKKKTK